MKACGILCLRLAKSMTSQRESAKKREQNGVKRMKLNYLEGTITEIGQDEQGFSTNAVILPAAVAYMTAIGLTTITGAVVAQTFPDPDPPTPPFDPGKPEGPFPTSF